MLFRYKKNLKIGVAVSGGADSMVMLHKLIKDGANITVINVEHGIRGSESINDSLFVKRFAEEANLPFIGYTADAPAEAEKSGVSIELAARNLRYAFFDKLLASREVDVIALAHHADDRAETVLMRLFRGTGVRGLRGIQDRDGYIHPLLGIGKKEILQYAEKYGVPFVTDSTNNDTAYTRNFIRKEIMPLIESRYPNFSAVTGRMCDNFAELEDYLLSEISESVSDGEGRSIDLAALSRHRAIAKKSVAECLRAMGVLRDIENSHLNSVLNLKDAENNAEVSLPFGIRAVREYDKIVFVKNTGRDAYEDLFDENGIYTFKGYAYTFTKSDRIINGLTFDADKIPEGTLIRTRREGDVFKRFGGGTKSLSDYLTDIKMPMRYRDRLLVAAKDEKVYLLLGVEISDDVKIAGLTEKILRINIQEEKDIQ